MTRCASHFGIPSMANRTRARLLVLLPLFGWGCGDTINPIDPPLDDAPPLLVLTVVVHVIHSGEPEGEGPNISAERVAAQLRILNEDFGREAGTPGFNDHPVGTDARIRFELAQTDPDGDPTNGIHRVDRSAVENPVPPDQLFDFYAHFGYWDPNRYINIWTMPLPEEATDIILGLATGPESTLPGSDLLTPGEPDQAEGILINAPHFGPSNLSTLHGSGRTLTHEMGHYLGLLHLWGDGGCVDNDFVADTPPVAAVVRSCPVPRATGCGGEPIQHENYMTYAPDDCMNLFTEEQVDRMRHVLATSPRRATLAH